MKTIIGAIALTLAFPAYAQTAPAVDPHAQHQGVDHSQHLASGQQSMEDMHKHCQEMMKHHGMDHGAKTSASDAKADDDHSGHAH